VLPEEIIEEIEFELEEISLLFELYKDDLFNLKPKPNIMEITAFAGILHSFYNGIEKIFLLIARDIDNKVPDESKWHKSLLLQMTTGNESRCAVLSGEMKERLLDYLAFRHFFRHTYSFHLEWEEMEDLVKSIGDVWNSFNSEISTFLKKIELD
jgi:hypothetical protein